MINKNELAMHLNCDHGLSVRDTYVIKKLAAYIILGS